VRPSLMSNFKTLRLECWHFIRFMLRGICAGFEIAPRTGPPMSVMSRNSRSLTDDLSLALSHPYLTLRFSPSRQARARCLALNTMSPSTTIGQFSETTMRSEPLSFNLTEPPTFVAHGTRRNSGKFYASLGKPPGVIRTRLNGRDKIKSPVWWRLVGCLKHAVPEACGRAIGQCAYLSPYCKRAIEPMWEGRKLKQASEWKRRNGESRRPGR
jgi:hypothetical protein